MKKYHTGNFEIWEYEELASTNSKATSLSEEEIKDKLVILTKKQINGKGQAGNSWESEVGKNLSLTVIWKPQLLDASEQFAVSMVIALACKDLISQYTANCEIKWPNDIYVGNKKIGGILIEHSIKGRYIERSICGIGLNINQSQFISDAPNPVSLFRLTDKEYNLDKLLGELLNVLDKRINQLKNIPLLKRDYLNSLYRRWGIYNWQDATGNFKASIEGINQYGQLVVKKETGEIIEYNFKEVSYL